MEQLFIDRFIIEGFEKVGFDTFHSFEDENECDEISISFEINSINLLPSYFHEITKYVLEQYDNNLNDFERKEIVNEIVEIFNFIHKHKEVLLIWEN